MTVLELNIRGTYEQQTCFDSGGQREIDDRSDDGQVAAHAPAGALRDNPATASAGQDIARQNVAR